MRDKKASINMNILDLIQKNLWAMTPDKLEAVYQVAHNRANDIKADLSAYEAQRDENGRTSYLSYMDDIAVLSIDGVLAKRMNLFMAFSGGSSMEILLRDFRTAMEDPDINGILLDVDSPGGTVDGTEAMASEIYNNRGRKPVVAFVNGLMASAAYWIGSAADRIVIEETGEAGSIGVYQMHADYSKADEKAGVNRTLIKAGKYKAAGNDAEPLQGEMLDYLQAGVDYVYSLFVDTVARQRRTSIAQVLKDMAEGKMFIGQQAIDAGLVDEIGNYDMALRAVKGMAQELRIYGRYETQKAEITVKEDIMSENKKVTVEELEAAQPDLIKNIRDEAMAGVDVETPKQEAAKAEKERILGLAEVQFGKDAAGKLKGLVESNVSVEQLQAIRALDPEPIQEPSGKMDEMLEELKKSGADNPGPNAQAQGPSNFVEAWQAIKKEDNCSTEAAMKKAYETWPDLHEAYLQGQGGRA